MSPLLVGIFIAIAGLCVGSFITAASYRLPRGENLVSKRSRCVKCNHSLGARDLVPVFSWLFAGGKCRYCKTSVSGRYLLTELFTAALFLWLGLHYGLTPTFAIMALLATAMLILIISDFETYLIPDSTTIAAFVLALAYHYYNTDDYTPYIYGFIAGLSVAVLLRYGYYLVTKKEGLGMGDVKFLPVAGLWVGWPMIPLFLVLSGLLGALTGVVWRWATGSREFPFGPALAVSMFLIVIFGSKITQLIQ